jgi:class 3 adenylate cyclase
MWMDGPGVAPDVEILSRIERYMYIPRGIVEYMGRNMEIDVRPVLPMISAPTLVVHATGDTIIPFLHGRLAAATIPGAELVALDLDYHGAWNVAGFDPYVDAFEEWFTGRPPQPPPRLKRVLSTVLFTDIVGSTSLASQLGDAQWRQTLDSHDQVCARTVNRYGGTRVKNTGDGVLATFDGPARALDCARSLRDGLRTEGLRIRAGVHAGEIEVRDDEDISGIAVNLAARVMGLAADDEIWVSPTIPGLVVGSGHRFEARGTHELKGIPGEWQLACLAN